MANPDNIIGQIASCGEFADELTQKQAWLKQIEILQDVLGSYEG